MKSFATDVNNDLFIGPDGLLAVGVDEQAVRYSCEAAMEAALGEMLYNRDNGVPFFETAFDRLNPAQFEAAARAQIRAVPNVLGIESFNIEVVGHVLRYTVEIRSTFGLLELVNAT